MNERPVVLRGGTVLTVAPGAGADDRIAAIGPRPAVPEATVEIDATGSTRTATSRCRPSAATSTPCS